MNLLQRPPARHAFSPSRLVFLSGLSDPGSCRLSPEQARFLGRFQGPGVDVVMANLPYVGDTPTRRPPALLVASVRNGGQFLRASSAAFRREAAPHWAALVASTERLVVITLSCGLEILNQCVAEQAPRIPVDVVALGPVARRAPRVPCTLVQGSGDWVSRAFFRRCDLVLSGVGHLGYIGQPRVVELVHKTLCSSTSRSLAPASIFPAAG